MKGKQSGKIIQFFVHCVSERSMMSVNRATSKLEEFGATDLCERKSKVGCVCYCIL